MIFKIINFSFFSIFFIIKIKKIYYRLLCSWNKKQIWNYSQEKNLTIFFYPCDTIKKTELLIKGQLGLVILSFYEFNIQVSKIFCYYYPTICILFFDKKFNEYFKSILIGVILGYQICLKISGIGYRIDSNINCENKFFIKLANSNVKEYSKRSYNSFCSPINSQLIQISSLLKHEINLLAAKIRFIKISESYTDKGVFFLHESIKKKLKKK